MLLDVWRAAIAVERQVALTAEDEGKRVVSLLNHC